jgi:hypothetical protein
VKKVQALRLGKTQFRSKNLSRARTLGHNRSPLVRLSPNADVFIMGEENAKSKAPASEADGATGGTSFHGLESGRPKRIWGARYEYIAILT